MTMVCTTPYRAPVAKPPIDVDVWPRYGIGRIEDYAIKIQMDSVFATEHTDPLKNPTFSLATVDEITYLYYLAPIEFGAVTFRDQSGLTGGWDGASWPLDDLGETYGPIEVMYQGRKWLLYRSDWGGNRANTYTVSFANG